jgi:hypothetical protein
MNLVDEDMLLFPSFSFPDQSSPADAATPCSGEFGNPPSDD